ncbi:Phosphopentomutase [Actinidia chinensis var. chinensis]|uniref:Phosphopentomutase n=1 Tax=Actinidia chinensis var. chinensis TaxID=1590841 RepID=A0A2R6R4N1_ACTCC|nr:Phosphopentomutase [Actinidia chinensis var. chinensis]
MKNRSTYHTKLHYPNDPNFIDPLRIFPQLYRTTIIKLPFDAKLTTMYAVQESCGRIRRGSSVDTLIDISSSNPLERRRERERERERELWVWEGERREYI